MNEVNEMKETYVSPNVELFQLTAAERIASELEPGQIPGTNTVELPFDSNDLTTGEGVVVVPILGNQ